MEEKPDIVIEFFKDNVHILLPIIIFGIVMLSLGYVMHYYYDLEQSKLRSMNCDKLKEIIIMNQFDFKDNSQFAHNLYDLRCQK